jgi:phasin family protein
MRSNAVFVKGVQDINKILFGFAQASLDDSVAATKKILGCKNVTEVIDAQAELAQAGYAKAIEDSRRINDMSVKLAEEAAQPLTKQVSATVEKFSKPIAA